MSLIDAIQKNRDQFVKFNNLKYERFQQLMPNQNVKRVINSIPLLLSLNLKELPGFINSDVPLGVAGYIPDDETVKFIQLRFHIKNLNYKHENPAIEMMAVMGSVGTIAYTKKSDFDYWVCIDKHRFSQDGLSAFNKKIEIIQKWALNEIKLEVHLFVNDIESIKNSIFAEDEDEAFGSTIGAVLKDEFFRSSIIVAGKIPFWWVIPKFISDSEYVRLYSRIPEQMKTELFVDLGNLFEISKEDFLGAALFQLIKSLGSPFKSIIKIGVLEKYLFGTDDSPLLSQKVKQNILRGIFDNRIIDSYILMFEEVYKHYESSLSDKNLLKILRQNLYLKIDPQLSRYLGIKSSANMPYKVVIMIKYVKEWEWSVNEIKELDDFDNWDYNRILQFWNQIKKFMLLSYQNISSQLPTLNLQNKISDSDFKLLSRKIKTHFTSLPDKIDNYITFKDTPYESMLYFEPDSVSLNDYEWRLYKRNTGNDDKPVSTVIQTDKSFLKLLSWVSVNQIYNSAYTRIKIHSGYHRTIQNHVQEILSTLTDLFNEKHNVLKNEYFLNETFCMVNAVVINFNIENADSIKTIHHIYQSSWGESYIREYSTDQELINLLFTIIKDGLKRKIDFDRYCVIISPEPHKKIYRDIQKLFKETYELINKASVPTRIISKFGSTFFVLTYENNELIMTTSPNWIRLLSFLSIKPLSACSYTFIGDDSNLMLINSAYTLCKKKTISIYYEIKGKFIIVYVINENGNLFTFIKSSENSDMILISFFNFIKQSITQLNASTQYNKINNDFYYYRITTDRFGKSTFVDETKQIEQKYLIKYETKDSLTAEILKKDNTDCKYNIHLLMQKPADYYSFNSIPLNFKELKNKNPKLKDSTVDLIKISDDKKILTQNGSNCFFLEKYKIEYILGKCNP